VTKFVKRDDLRATTRSLTMKHSDEVDFQA
jgi:hypothetical protein